MSLGNAPGAQRAGGLPRQLPPENPTFAARAAAARLPACRTPTISRPRPAADTVYSQKASDRKRKMTERLAGAASEPPSEEIVRPPLPQDPSFSLSQNPPSLPPAPIPHSLTHPPRPPSPLYPPTHLPQTLWSAPATRGEKPLQKHDELPEEFKDYIQWHNARREARRVRRLGGQCLGRAGRLLRSCGGWRWGVLSSLGWV